MATIDQASNSPEQPKGWFTTTHWSVVLTAGDSHSLTGGFWALPIAVPTPDTPTLRIVPASPGLATISWGPASPGVMLKMSDNLTAPLWSDAPSGAANPTTVPATFYRLRKP